MAKQTFTTGQVLTAAQMSSLQQTAMGGGDTTAKTTSYVLVAADAGTTVAMNAAGSTTITVNTGLFAAGDTVFIQNRGAGVCTITAGTATVNTHGSLALAQYEGGQLYFTATGAAIFFDISQSTGMTNPMTNTGDTIYSSSGSTPARLGIGSTGNVLTVAGGVPTWAAPAGGGKVLQVVSATTTTLTTIASTTLTDTGITATITPTLSTSKILVLISASCYPTRSSDNAWALGRVFRGGTTILDYDTSGGGFVEFGGATVSGSTSVAVNNILGINYLDSPATTSATTYKVQARAYSTANSGQVRMQAFSAPSTITLMEIGA